METLLINKTDFVPYRNITANMDDSKRLEPFILEAQRIDLPNLMGKRLYFDLIDKITSYEGGVALAAAADPPTTYTPTVDELWFKKLLDGASYTYTWPDRSTSTKIYAGLKPVLVYLSYARFVRSDNVRSTQSGFVKKNGGDFSVQVSDKEIQATASRAEADANAFFTGAEEFMKDNYPYFGKYLSGEGSQTSESKRTGTRLSSVKGRSYFSDRKTYLR
jgi:hypothetical protein